MLVAGCNKTDTGGAIDAGGSAAAPTPAVIQGACPQVYLLDGTANYRTYAKGAKDDPTKIVYQASLADTTRQCVQNESQLAMTVVVQGRVVCRPRRRRRNRQPADPRRRHRRQEHALFRTGAISGRGPCRRWRHPVHLHQGRCRIARRRRRLRQGLCRLRRRPGEEEEIGSSNRRNKRTGGSVPPVFVSSSASFQAISDSDHSDSAAMTPGSALMREITVSAPASVSLSACEG